ncbi:MAG: lysophospholipid acyltransferase family protein [Roseiflexaceae bacterium]
MLGAIMYFLIWLPLQVVRYCWWNWKIEGLEHLPSRDQGMVLAINHLHWLDILIIGASLPLSHRPSWIAKSEIFSNRLFAWWLHQMLVIPIRRGQRDVAALGAAQEALGQGAVLIIFPEGHRSRGGELQEGRSGAVRLAMRSGCPIVPIAIWGTEVGLKGVLLRKPIRFRIGKPYVVSAEGDKSAWNRTSMQTEELMLRIAELMPEAYWGFYRERMLQDGGQAMEASR